MISCLKPTKKCDLAFDEGLAQRVTELLADNPCTTQKQMFGGMGVSAETPLAKMWAAHRALRLSDGPDEVHREMISRSEIGKFPHTYL